MNSTPETAEIISRLISLRYLTRDTLAVFLAFAGTSEDEGRDPEVDCTSPRDKGHITNLKKAGLVTTYVCPGDEWRVLWMGFTDKGKAVARAHGIRVWGDEARNADPTPEGA